MQTPLQVLNIGADVAKDEIVVACSEGSFPVRKLANQRTALRFFLKSLPPGNRIGMESTGIYHEVLANLAHQYCLVDVHLQNRIRSCATHKMLDLNHRI